MARSLSRKLADSLPVLPRDGRGVAKRISPCAEGYPDLVQ